MLIIWQAAIILACHLSASFIIFLVHDDSLTHYANCYLVINVWETYLNTHVFYYID